MPKQVKHRRTKRRTTDVNQIAKQPVDQAPEIIARDKPLVPSVVSAYMSQIGRRGGKESGKHRMENLSPEQRSEIAHRAAQIRWEREKKRKGA